MFSFFKKSNKDKTLKKGFSIIELMVVLAIFAIMTGILVADIPNFRDKSSLDLTISEVATYVRGAQVYGSAQKGAETSVVSYGVHFDRTNQRFFLFKDNDLSNPVEPPYSLNGFKFENILIRHGDDHSTYLCGLSELNVIYQANTYGQNIGTNLEAAFNAKLSSGGAANIPSYDYADIKIKSSKNPKGQEGCLRIYRNGQITTVNCLDESFGLDNRNCSN